MQGWKMITHQELDAYFRDFVGSLSDDFEKVDANTDGYYLFHI